MDGRSFSGTYSLPADIRDYLMCVEYLDVYNIEELIDLSEKSHKNSAWQDYHFDRDILRKNLEKMIGKTNYFTCMYRSEGKIIGYYFASLGTFLFSSVLLGMENGIYIEPEHRGARVAVTMHKEFIAWCDKMGVEPLVEVYFGESDRNAKVYQFFTKVGMIECGKVFRGGKNGLR